MNFKQASDFYQRSVKPGLFMLDPELAHSFGHQGLPLIKSMTEFGVISKYEFPDNLKQEFLGEQLNSPIGLAAGFDKNASLLDQIDCLGFGFAEIGSITAKASAGNPKPRLFRLPRDEAIINYMGLNGDGAEVVAERLKYARPNLPYGINIAKTNDATICGDKAVEDIVFSFKSICKLPATYVAINVSCPNTQEEISAIARELGLILEEISNENVNKLPIFVKLSPDSEQSLLDEILSVTANSGVKGFICGNTSVDRSLISKSTEELSSIKSGGMSGKPLKEKAIKLVEKIHRARADGQLIIACGGVFSGADAYAYLCAGASLIEIYTSLIYRGPFAACLIAEELSEILKRESQSIADCVGSNLAKVR